MVVGKIGSKNFSISYPSTTVPKYNKRIHEFRKLY